MMVLSAGMVSAVGLTVEASCAAIRAGISGFARSAYADNNGEAIIAAAVPGLEGRLAGRQRLVRLLVPAIEECLRGAPAGSWTDIPLLIGLAEQHRPGGPREPVDMLDEVQETLGVRFHPQLSGLVPEGHVAGYVALNAARSLMTQGQVRACLVAAADSFLNAQSLSWLDRHWRLKRRDNSDGVIPGEAGCALLVAADSRTADRMRVLGLGFAQEPAHVLNEEPLRAAGLSRAVGAALSEAGVGLEDIAFRVSDLSGESYGFKEHSLTLSRLLRKRMEAFPLWHFADSIGDVGAASGLAALILVDRAFARGYAPGRRAMCCGSATFGARAAAVVTASART